ncbi:uncharacterized protein [Zea mays]|uniref:uncharacterized protein n=1 Tax=Zea mays TaxID=4577 RepID=UPI0009A96B90|nr:uncharacterized protein LOC103635686 [Zea mays]|eukprot:XP_020397951.1 uncharacterized protein LOC103635686 [Zea mays]
MGNLQGLNGATVGFSAAGGPEEATEEEDMRGCKGCARRWPKSGLSWGCARSRRWRREPRLFNEGYGFGKQGNSWRLCLLEKASFLPTILFQFWIDHYRLCSFVLHLLPLVVTQEQLDCAKEAIESTVLMNLESRAKVTCLCLVIML